MDLQFSGKRWKSSHERPEQTVIRGMECENDVCLCCRRLRPRIAFVHSSGKIGEIHYVRSNHSADLLPSAWWLCITDTVPGRNKRKEPVSYVRALRFILLSVLFLFWARMAVGIFVLFPSMHRHSESQIPENQLYLGSGTALLYAAYLPDFSITKIFKIRKNI